MEKQKEKSGDSKHLSTLRKAPFKIKEIEDLFTKKEKQSFIKAKEKMFRALENLWVDYVLTIQELRELKMTNQIKIAPFKIKENHPINSETPKELKKWMNLYHDMFIIAHNTLMEMSKLYKLKKIKDKKIKNMIDRYLVRLK